MKKSIFSILFTLTIIIASPLVFADQVQTEDQIADNTETYAEASEPSNISEVIESIAAKMKECCTGNADDDFDEKIDCEDTDCVKDPECIGGY